MHKLNTKNKKKLLIIGGLLLIFVVIIVVMGVVRSQKQDFKIPPGINYGIWYPSTQKSGYKVQADSSKYDAGSKTITFLMQNSKGNVLTFSEQPVPESVSVLPEAFDKQLDSLPQVTKFDSINGTVAVTKPNEGGQVTAIMRAKGTLVYVYSKNQIQTDEWRVIFNDLELKQ